MRGEGEDLGEKGLAGDLYIEVTIKPHPIFQRQDTEIVCEVPIHYAQAVLGGEVEVPTLSGGVMLKIPAGTVSGKVFRLRGKGIVDMRTKRPGDEHVRIVVEVPKKVSTRERELLNELLALKQGVASRDGAKSNERSGSAVKSAVKVEEAHQKADGANKDSQSHKNGETGDREKDFEDKSFFDKMKGFFLF